MKAKQLRQMTVADLVARERELNEEIFRLRLKLRSGQAEKPSDGVKARRALARIKTIIREKKREVKPAGASGEVRS
jgi:large subunit ribosomal protein L29